MRWYLKQILKGWMKVALREKSLGHSEGMTAGEVISSRDDWRHTWKGRLKLIFVGFRNV